MNVSNLSSNLFYILYPIYLFLSIINYYIVYIITNLEHISLRINITSSLSKLQLHAYAIALADTVNYDGIVYKYIITYMILQVNS
jgi:hypothetical protein